MVLTAYDILGLGYGVCDLGGRLVSFDPLYAVILARTHDQMRDITAGAVTHPDDRASYLAAVDLVARSKRPVAMRKRSLRPDGSCVWVENRLTPLFGDQMQILIATRIVGSPREPVQTDADWALPGSCSNYAADIAGQLAHMCRCGGLDLTAELLNAAADLAPMESEMILRGDKGPN